MPFFKIRSLQHRLVIFLLIPMALILFVMGLLGYLYARNAMLNEWQEASILKLERAAHHIDMRLQKVIEWIERFNKTGEMKGEHAVQEWIFEKLEQLEGVTKVKLKWMDSGDEKKMQPGIPGMGFNMGKRRMRFHSAGISEVTPPRHDAQIGYETISLISKFRDEPGNIIATLEVAIRFDHLLQDIQTLGWWQSDLAGLVDDRGRYIAHTETMVKGHEHLGQTDDALEITLLEVMRKKSFGTLRGPGHPPKRVSGFFKLKHAPWTIVIFAPGKKILAPIIRFRLYYSIAWSLCIIFIIILIRFTAGRTADNIKEISAAAEKVAMGTYGDPLPVNSSDEIGQLILSFNTMLNGLKERDFISNTFGRYVDPEIARELIRRPEASRLGGEKREVAILMSDLRNFTPMSESLSPEDTIGMLNRYFSDMIKITERYKGIIVDFFGDAILVFFDPLDGPVTPSIRLAIQCALEMQYEMEGFNLRSRAEGLPEVQMGVGVNAGEVVVGNIGSDIRAKYGIVGAPVNLTHRIQSLAKAGEVIVSESIYLHLNRELVVRKSFDARLKGVREPIQLYVLNGLRNDFRDISQ